MKLKRPTTICTDCGTPGYNIGLASGKCGHMIGRKRCKGTKRSAIGEKVGLSAGSVQPQV